MTILLAVIGYIVGMTLTAYIVSRNFKLDPVNDSEFVLVTALFWPLSAPFVAVSLASIAGRKHLSKEEQELRKPLPPEILIDAKQDVVHNKGKSRAVKAKKISKKNIL
jgi:hypothetical protein